MLLSSIKGIGSPIKGTENKAKKTCHGWRDGVLDIDADYDLHGVRHAILQNISNLGNCLLSNRLLPQVSEICTEDLHE